MRRNGERRARRAAPARVVLRRAVFLDRDGVINRCEVRNGKPYAPRRLADFRLLPNAARAVEELKQAGFVIIVVTNQPDIGNGLVDPAVVSAMHDKLRRAMPVDDVWICPHRQDAGCSCRKPRPGLLLAAARKWHVDLARSFLIGDRRSDIVAGQAAGCYSVFVNRRYGEPAPEQPDGCATSLPSAVEHILTRSNHPTRSPMHAFSK